MVVDHFHIIGVAVFEAKDEAPVPGQFQGEKPLAVAFQGVKARSGQVQIGERFGPVYGVEQGLDPAGEIGWQCAPVSVGEALSATGPVGADGHGAMLPEPGNGPRKSNSDEEFGGFPAAQ